MSPPGRSAALRGLYGDRPLRRETPPPTQPRPPRQFFHRSHSGTDTPDSGFFDDERENNTSQSELGRIARREEAEANWRQQQQHATQAQAEEDAQMHQAIAASIATAEQAKEEEDLEMAMIQSQIDYEAVMLKRAQQEVAARQQVEQEIATRRRAQREDAARRLKEHEEAAQGRRIRAEAALKRAEQERSAQAVRQRTLADEATAHWREEEEERQRGFSDAEQKENQRAVVAKSELENHQCAVVEVQEHRGSLERSQAAASKTSKPSVSHKEPMLDVLSKASEETLENQKSNTPITSPKTSESPISSSKAAPGAMWDQSIEEPGRPIRAVLPKPPTPPVPPMNAEIGVGSDNSLDEVNDHVGSAVRFPPVLSSLASSLQVPSPQVSYQQTEHGDQATPKFPGRANPLENLSMTSTALVSEPVPETGGQVNFGINAVTRQMTPLPAPIPRRTEVPQWAMNRPLSVFGSSSESTRDTSSQNTFADQPAQPPALLVSQNASSTALSSMALREPVSADNVSLEVSSNQTVALSPPQLSQPSPPAQYNTYNGPVSINHNDYVSVPVTQVEKIDSKNKLLKRAIQGYQRLRGRENSDSSAAASSQNQTQSIVSQLRAGFKNLNLGADRYVTAADMAQRVIDEGYDSPARSESLDTNSQLLAKLERAQDRLRTPAHDTYQPSRLDYNGSPVSFRHPPLRLVTSRSPASSTVPARRPVPSGRASSPYTDPRNADVSQGSPSQHQGLSISNINCAEQQAPMHSSTPGIAHFAQNEHLSHQSLAASDRPRMPPPTYLCPPVPDVELTAANPSLYEQYPVGAPDADRHSTNTPSSTFAEPDASEYQQAALMRRHNPPRMTDWGNVPAPHDNLPFVNSRAMMGVDRFGHDSQTQVPILPALVIEKENVTRQKATSYMRAREAENKAQKSMREKL